MDKRQTLIPLLNSINKNISTGNYIKTKQSILITVSGGQDSICLFFIFIQLKKQWNWAFGIIYCNHLWQENSFFSGSLILKVAYLFSVSIYYVTTTDKIFSEQDARKWRYTIFFRLSWFYDYTIVSNGHTESDKIETILFQFIRGGSLKSLLPLKTVKNFASNSKFIKNAHIKNTFVYLKRKLTFFRSGKMGLKKNVIFFTIKKWYKPRRGCFPRGRHDLPRRAGSKLKKKTKFFYISRDYTDRKNVPRPKKPKSFVTANTFRKKNQSNFSYCFIKSLYDFLPRRNGGVSNTTLPFRDCLSREAASLAPPWKKVVPTLMRPKREKSTIFLAKARKKLRFFQPNGANFVPLEGNEGQALQPPPSPPLGGLGGLGGLGKNRRFFLPRSVDWGKKNRRFLTQEVLPLPRFSSEGRKLFFSQETPRGSTRFGKKNRRFFSLPSKGRIRTKKVNKLKDFLILCAATGVKNLRFFLPKRSYRPLKGSLGHVRTFVPFASQEKYSLLCQVFVNKQYIRKKTIWYFARSSFFSLGSTEPHFTRQKLKQGGIIPPVLAKALWPNGSNNVLKWKKNQQCQQSFCNNSLASLLFFPLKKQKDLPKFMSKKKFIRKLFFKQKKYYFYLGFHKNYLKILFPNTFKQINRKQSSTNSRKQVSEGLEKTKFFPPWGEVVPTPSLAASSLLGLEKTKFFLTLVRGIDNNKLVAQNKLAVRKVFNFSTTSQNMRFVVRPITVLDRFKVKKLVQYFVLPIYPDTSNKKKSYYRNRVRSELIPTLRFFFNPQLHRSFFQFSDILVNEQFYLNLLCKQLIPELYIFREKQFLLNITLFQNLPRAVQTKLVKMLVKDCTKTQPNFSNIIEITKLVKKPRLFHKQIPICSYKKNYFALDPSLSRKNFVFLDLKHKNWSQRRILFSLGKFI